MQDLARVALKRLEDSRLHSNLEFECNLGAGFRLPSAQHAYGQLRQALQDQLNWETRAKLAKERLKRCWRAGRWRNGWLSIMILGAIPSLPQPLKSGVSPVLLRIESAPRSIL